MATYDLANSIPSMSSLKIGDILNCSYSGTSKEITLPKGQYKFECWGAQGGTYNSIIGGKGGYSSGTLTITEKTLIYLYTGGSGSSSSTSSGFNGGGNGISNGRGGGGGSDIRINQDSLYARIIVAGGGGGAGVATASANPAGCGGGLYGGDGYYNDTTGSYIVGVGRCGGSASQTAGGTAWSSVSQASFGQGGNALGYSCGGGGGGWYGGGGAYDNDSDLDGRWGGGGSGYVYTSSTASNYPSGCLLNSSYYLTNASTIAGNTSFTSPSGTSEIGHTGNGHIRITILQIETTGVYIKIPSKIQLPSAYTQLEYIKGTGTQYIDTGFKPNNNSGYEIKFQMNATTNTIAIMGAETSWQSVSYAMWAKHLAYGNDTITNQSWDSSNTNSPVIFAFDKTQFKKNNENIYQFNSASFSCLYNTYIFGTNRGGNFNEPSDSLSVYYCKIYDNGTLIRNFIPAKRKSDSVLGLYDLVNNKFYTNAGTGTFIAGPEETPWKTATNIYIKVNGKWIEGEV